MRLLLCALTLCFSSANLAESVVLETPQGKLIGETTGPNHAVNVFRGISFSAPPVGSRRWQPPTEPTGWAGELLATDFGPNCMQEPYAEASFFYRPARLTSEDCLYLIVWTTAETDPRLPVMVWLRGGNNSDFNRWVTYIFPRNALH